MTSLSYTTHERIWLKGHPEFDEKWLQDRIAEDPTILGLGEVVVLDRERTHERVGRLNIPCPARNKTGDVKWSTCAGQRVNIP